MKPQLLYPLLISLLLHCVIFALFALSFRLPGPKQHDANTERPALRITIRSSAQTSDDPTDVENATGIASAASEPEPPPTAMTENVSTASAPRVLTFPDGESGPRSPTQEDESPTSEVMADAPIVQSTQRIRDAVNQVLDTRASNLEDCSPQQRRNALFDCEEENTVDYERLTQNSTYAYFIPSTEPDRAGTSTTPAQRMRDQMFMNDRTNQLRKQVMGETPLSMER